MTLEEREKLLSILITERNKARANKADNNWFNKGYFAGEEYAFQYIINLLTERKDLE